jgi:TonB family protein
MNRLLQQEARTGESLIVLTTDDSLIVTLEAVAPNHPLAVLGSEADLPGYLLADQAGVAVIDTAAISTPVARLTERLAAQFPDLVIIVAGDHHDQNALSAQVTRGTVYRFLHKPASAQRVKLFVDAAWRRHEEGNAPMTATRARSTPPPEPLLSRNTLIVGALAVLAAVGVAMWMETRKEQTPPVAQAPAAAEQQQRVPNTPATKASVEPSALIESDPRLEPLLARAEQALLANKVDDAERLVEQARSLEPDNVRVAFFTAQIKKERERAVLAAARNAAASGNINRALNVLEGARREAGPSTLVNETRQDITVQLNERVVSLLQRADQRIREGALVEPAQDNARFYIESAAAIAPDNAQVREAERDLASRLLARGRSLLAAGNTDEGERWLAAASDAGAAPDDITTVRRDIARARINAKADSMARLSQLFNQRLSQGRLMDQTDSARSYLAQLEQSDASHPSTRLARVSLSGRLLEEARSATLRGDLATAQSFVANARRLGASAVTAATIEREIAAARDFSTRADLPISAARLERTRYVPPEYPMEARQRGLSGAVELTFTVGADGRVSDVNVESATPPRVFDEAAVDAVRKWRYRPYERNGQAVDQRVKLILRFAME